MKVFSHCMLMLAGLWFFSKGNTLLAYSENNCVTDMVRSLQNNHLVNDTCNHLPRLISPEEVSCFSGDVVKIAVSHVDSVPDKGENYYYLFIRDTRERIEAISQIPTFWIADSGHFTIMEVILSKEVNPNFIINRSNLSLKKFKQTFLSLPGCNYFDSTGFSFVVPICVEPDTTPGSELANANQRLSYPKEKQTFSIVPNPSNQGNITLVNSNPQKGWYEVRAFDAGGRLIFIRRFKDLKEETPFDLGEIAPGLYFIHIVAPDQEVFQLKLSLL